MRRLPTLAAAATLATIIAGCGGTPTASLDAPPAPDARTAEVIADAPTAPTLTESPVATPAATPAPPDVPVVDGGEVTEQKFVLPPEPPARSEAVDLEKDFAYVVGYELGYNMGTAAHGRGGGPDYPNSKQAAEDQNLNILFTTSALRSLGTEQNAGAVLLTINRLVPELRRGYEVGVAEGFARRGRAYDEKQVEEAKRLLREHVAAAK
jgi:hypothetical protein